MVSSPNVCNSQGWAGPRAPARPYAQVAGIQALVHNYLLWSQETLLGSCTGSEIVKLEPVLQHGMWALQVEA